MSQTADGAHKYGSLVAALKPIREAAGLKQVDLAQKLGWADGSHVSNVERGNRGTTLDLVERWIEACGHDIYIISRDGAHRTEDALPLIASLSESDRALVLRMARLLPLLDDRDRDRFDSDMKYLERRVSPLSR